ncbi:MAG: ABC transporter permease subunit [Planctomycetota bacterium]|nr:ABC transporter permease subunit [Planctomycetota bacterium]
MTGLSAPRRGPAMLALVGALLLASALLLDWNFEAVHSWANFSAALDRLGGYLSAFVQPDLRPELLQQAAWLSLETIAVALLGVALGLVFAWPLALGASRAVVVGEEPLTGVRGALRRLFLEACRLLLDILRGVPDFAWAIVIANFTGTNSVTGMLAISTSVAGILGKVLSEQWDNIDPARYAALRSTGASRLAVLFYGTQPLAARAMLSFVLMRTECAVRNASVIGVVGGGGLGAGLWDYYNDGQWSSVSTILLFMLLVTASTDLSANFLRYQLRSDPNHPRRQRSLDVRRSNRRRLLSLGIVGGLLVGSIAILAQPLGRVFEELTRIDGTFVSNYTFDLLLSPDLSADALAAAARESVVPIALGLLATAFAIGFAALLTFPASVAFQLDASRFTGEHHTLWVRIRRTALLVAARGLGLVLRGVPEVAWVVILSMFFKKGLTPCAFAIMLHSVGVLLRVFAETLDNIPYRRLEQVSGACRPHIFLYGALPEAWRDWKTYAFFQFEVNVRIGVVLGMVGAGGLGDAFQTNLLFRENHRAGTFLWAMVLLTVLIDRLSRRLLLERKKC